ncbi:MAG: SLAP domain-containing protein, partial [Lactobacillus sp.]|nr:SLAP domain-containing protein [Lactobacillus sp.]
ASGNTNSQQSQRIGENGANRESAFTANITTPISAVVSAGDTSAVANQLKGKTVEVKLPNTAANGTSFNATVDSASDVKVTDSDNENVTKLEFGKSYTATATVNLSGFAKNAFYKVGNETIQANDKGVLTLNNVKFSLVATDVNATAAYFVNAETNQQIPNGGLYGNTVKADFTNVDTLLAALKGTAYVIPSPNSEVTTTANDIKNQLTNQGIKVDNSNNYNANGQKYTITLTVKNNKSGNTATVKINFYNEADAYAEFPIIQFRSLGTRDWVNLKQGEKVFNTTNSAAIVLTENKNDLSQFKPTDYFRAIVNSHVNNQYLSNLKVVSNNVDTHTPGVYSVTVEATNNAGKTTSVKVPVYVNGENGVVKVISTKPGYPVNLYKIFDNGNVEDANDQATYYNGEGVLTFDTKTVDGVEYTRVGKADANLWIKSSDLKVIPKELAKTGEVKVMHNSYIYDKNHNRIGTGKIATYSEVSVYGTTTINGKKFYRISATKDQYIDAENVDGVKRPLKHNAYVYATSKKRANKTVMKKGTEVVTYGSAVKFSNGKEYYRIEGCTAAHKMYIKKANF